MQISARIPLFVTSPPTRQTPAEAPDQVNLTLVAPPQIDLTPYEAQESNRGIPACIPFSPWSPQNFELFQESKATFKDFFQAQPEATLKRASEALELEIRQIMTMKKSNAATGNPAAQGYYQALREELRAQRNQTRDRVCAEDPVLNQLTGTNPPGFFLPLIQMAHLSSDEEVAPNYQHQAYSIKNGYFAALSEVCKERGYLSIEPLNFYNSVYTDKKPALPEVEHQLAWGARVLSDVRAGEMPLNQIIPRANQEWGIQLPERQD